MKLINYIVIDYIPDFDCIYLTAVQLSVSL